MFTIMLLQAAEPAAGSYDITLAVYCLGAVVSLIALLRLIFDRSDDDWLHDEPAAGYEEKKSSSAGKSGDVLQGARGR